MTAIFTNEDFAIGGSPKIQEGTVALGFINLQDIDKINNHHVKHNVETHTENTIFNLKNRRIDFIGFHDTPDDVIRLADTMEYSVVIVCDVGTFINSGILIDILKSMAEGVSLVGHLLDKQGQYYQIHNQCFFLNIEHWREAGARLWNDRETEKLQNVDRSGENFHDGYTPKQISKGQGKSEYLSPANGSKIISSLLESGRTVRPFDDNERRNKYFLYHNDEWKAGLRIADQGWKTSASSLGFMYTIETEKVPDLQIDDHITSYIGICASLHPFRMIRRFGLTNLRHMCLYDKSYAAVEFYKYLNVWDGQDWSGTVRSFQNSHPEDVIGTVTDQQLEKYFDTVKQFCEPWEFVYDTYHDTRKEFMLGDLTTDAFQRSIMHRQNDQDIALFHVSNIFNYEIGTYNVSILSRYFSWLNLLFYAKKYTKRTHFLGSNIFGKSYYNTDDLDLGQCIDKVDDLVFAPWQEQQVDSLKESIEIRYNKNMRISI